MVEGTEGSHHKGGSTKMAKDTTICAGIDTGKRKLDVALDGSSEQLQVGNTPEGYKVLSDWLRRHRVKRIAIAAGGGSRQPLVRAAPPHGISRERFHPPRIRPYVRLPPHTS